MKNRQHYLNIARQIASEVGGFLKSRFGGVKDIEQKEEGHFSVAEDVRANKLYEIFLREKTPEVGLYTEEGERYFNSELVWVIDPIEGTTNYGAGLPFFATQICLLKDGHPEISVINAPILKMEFWAEYNAGAYLNSARIKVNNSSLEKSLIAFDKGGSIRKTAQLIDTFSDKVRALRWFGALGLSLSFVARGGMDMLINIGSQLYDYPAGVLMVREAGGVVKNFKGDDWNINDREIVTGNKHIVEEVLEILKRDL